MSNADQLERTAETHRAHLTHHITALSNAINPETTAKRAVGQTADLGQRRFSMGPNARRPGSR